MLFYDTQLRPARGAVEEEESWSRLELRRECQEYLAPELVIGRVSIGSAAGCDLEGCERRILVEHVVDADPQFQRLPHVPGCAHVQVTDRRQMRAEVVVGPERSIVERRVGVVVVEPDAADIAPAQRGRDIPRRKPCGSENVVPTRIDCLAGGAE